MLHAKLREKVGPVRGHVSNAVCRVAVAAAAIGLLISCQVTTHDNYR